MTEFVLVSANDIHISDNGPRGRIDDFKGAVLDKLTQMSMACSKLNADAAIITGDLYNLKNPAKNTHALNIDLIRVFKTFPCPIYMIEGNHDLTGNNLDSLKDQPLGVLFADGTLRQLRHETIKKNDQEVSLVGVPYIENLDLTTLNLPSNENYAAQICIMHLYAGIKAGMLYRERLYGYDELAKLPADIFVLGHYHVDQGIYEDSGKYFMNIGSLSRGTQTEEDIEHHPQIGLIKIAIEDGKKPEFVLRSIKLRIKPAGEIFNMAKKAEEKREKEEIQVFVEKLAAEAAKGPVDKTKSIEDIITSMDMAKIIRDRVMHFIQEAQGVQHHED
jgi:DNA repair exonuclease SbcCD nuclease subunit